MAARKIKVVMLGEASVGKTCLVHYWTTNEYKQEAPTVGCAYKIMNMEIEDKQYEIHIWDTAGSEQFRSISPVYTRNADIGIIVFSLTSKESFRNLIEWIEILQQGENVPFIIVGNKADLTDDRAVSQEEAVDFANSLNTRYYEASALTGFNVEELFEDAVVSAIATGKEEPVEEVIELKPSNDIVVEYSESRCC